ncbi:MAG: hypothetical protein JWM93_1815 [Frankiales bacterium]|nr:hypothetical protein [Frankiales bacterium]
MWETRLDADGVEGFWSDLRRTWQVLASYDGFLGGESFASAAGEDRAVVLTRWRAEVDAGAITEWEAALDVHAARPGHGWFFTPVVVPREPE